MQTQLVVAKTVVSVLGNAKTGTHNYLRLHAKITELNHSYSWEMIGLYTCAMLSWWVSVSK